MKYRDLPKTAHGEPLNADNVRICIQYVVMRHQWERSLTETVLNVFRKFDGKQVTRRMTNALKEALPELIISMSDDLWISIWQSQGEHTFDQKFYFKLCDTSEKDAFNFDVFYRWGIEQVESHTARIEQAANLLNWVDGAVENYNKAINDMKHAREAFKNVSYAVFK